MDGTIELGDFVEASNEGWRKVCKTRRLKVIDKKVMKDLMFCKCEFIGKFKDPPVFWIPEKCLKLIEKGA